MHQKGTVKLLYVEDDPITMDMVTRIILKRFPTLNLITAENGQAGLDLFKEQVPDLVLTDVSMPVMNGIDMARSIRSLNPAAHIIAATAISDTRFLLEAIKTGITRYVLKPIDFPVLFEAINDCLARIMLEREKLQQEQKLESLGLLAGELAQDFNSILSGIQGNLSLARFQMDDPEQVAQRLDNAEKATARAKDLTEELLTFASAVLSKPCLAQELSKPLQVPS